MSEHGRFRAIAELVGVLGVAGSLIFVGLQVRQNAAAIRAATAQEVSTGFRDLNLVIASTPELAAILATETVPDSLTPGQREQVSGFWRAIFHVWSNTHYQYVNGTLDRVLFEPTLTEVTKYAPRPAFRRLWDSQRLLYNPRFGEFMDSVLAAAPGEQAGPMPEESVPGPEVEALIAAAAGDFERHGPRPMGFRNVRSGYLANADGTRQYRLCGEVLARAEGREQWLAFATLQTSGYEQWIGGQSGSFCADVSATWQAGDLSHRLQDRVAQPAR